MFLFRISPVQGLHDINYVATQITYNKESGMIKSMLHGGI